MASRTGDVKNSSEAFAWRNVAHIATSRCGNHHLGIMVARIVSMQ